jgi:Ca2+-binding EF-hand superfamily protein
MWLGDRPAAPIMSPSSPSPLDLTEEQTAKLSAVLSTGKAALSFDKIGSKEINTTELNILLKLFGMEDLTDTLMQKLDSDHSDSLSFEELLAAVGAQNTG